MSLLDDASIVVVPSGYKAGTVYSVKPTDGSGDLSFTRALDTATRVGSDGLIEKVRTNLVLQSQTFDNASWAKQQGGTGLVPVVTANNAVAPDGTMTADTIVFDSGAGTTSSDESMIRQNITIVAGTFTGSFFARVTSGTGQLMFRHVFGGPYTTANLTTTYQRFSSIEVGTAGAKSFEIGIRRGLANEPINSSVTVEMWGCQLEVSDFGATPYISTTTTAVSVGMLANVPRLDYLGGGCPKLLLEPQRTNLIAFSEQINASAWAKTSITVTANTTISPDGFQNADSLEFSTSTSRATRTLSLGAGTYTASVYAKLVSGTGTARINLVVDSVNTSLTFTPTNEWERYTLTVTAATGLTQYQLRGSAGTPTVAFWGAQLEVGSYATSYIPTLGAAVTRSADSASKTGISALIGQTEGTLFLEADIFNLSEPRRAIVLVQDSNSFITLRISGGNNLQFLVFASSAIQANFTIANPQGNVKMALAYKANDFAAFLNGTLVGTDTSGSVPTASDFYLGHDPSGTLQIASGISQALVFPTRLTNAQLEELTTL